MRMPKKTSRVIGWALRRQFSSPCCACSMVKIKEPLVLELHETKSVRKSISAMTCGLMLFE